MEDLQRVRIYETLRHPVKLKRMFLLWQQKGLLKEEDFRLEFKQYSKDDLRELLNYYLKSQVLDYKRENNQYKFFFHGEFVKYFYEKLKEEESKDEMNDTFFHRILKYFKRS